MKNLFKTLSLIGLSLSLSMGAQTGSNKAKTIAVPQNEAKASYVMNQEYLAPTSDIGFQSYYGDSLSGFEEIKIKKELLARGLPGWESQIHMRNLKRKYINAKYNIGAKKPIMPIFIPVKNQSTGSVVNGKPLGGGTAVINSTPCVNEDFESTTPAAYTTSNAVSGWTVSERTNDSSCNPTNWTAGSSEFQILATPLLNWHGLFSTMGAIPNSPLGGSNVAELNDAVNNVHQTRIAQQFPVTTANTVFQFAYAGYWEDGGSGHLCCPASGDQPGMGVKMYDCQGQPLACSDLSISPGSGCQSSNVSFSTTSSASWSNWQVKYIDLTPYIGSCITIEITTTDCAFGGHWGSTLFDARCGGQVIGSGMTGSGGSVGGPVSFCAGSNQAVIAAPLGYSSYQWYAPSGSVTPANGGTLATLPISAPVAGDVYTVVMTAPSGCVFTSTNAISFSTITIAGIGSFSTCAGGASGSATVVGNGSGTGYNYTWISAATSATVGTTMVVNNLVPGTYSVLVTAFGASGCGQATATVNVGTSPPGIQTVLKPFCGTEAYLSAPGSGSNYQWYNGLSAISATAGGTAFSYTVNNPSTGSIYWLSRLSSQGCQDSIQYTLVSSTPGFMYVSNIGKICPGGSNGVASVSLAPASGAPTGLTSYLVVGTGTTPAYTSSLYPTSQNSYSFGGLSGGTYSVSVFDGSCKYSTNFTLTPYIFSYNLNIISASLCPGSSTQAAVAFNSFVSPNDFTFQWSPTTFMYGGNAQNAIITPTIPPGPNVVTVYTVVVTPNVVNCPIKQTMTITAVHPPIPTFSVIPPLCNTFNPYQIVAYPPGGVFSSTSSVVSPGGIITPSLANTSSANGGVNTFTYVVTPSYICSASATKTYQVSQFYSSALSSTVPPLCSSGQPFNLMNIVVNTQFGTWSSAMPNSPTGMINPAGTDFVPNVAPNGLATGNYVIKYSVASQPNTTVCPSTTTLNVVVTHTSLPNITPVAEFCTNSTPFSLTVNPTGGGWVTNTNGAVSNGGLVSPTLVPVPGMSVTYTVIDGPCLNSNTLALSVSRFYTAGFTAPIPNLCYNSAPINLMTIVQNVVNGSWSQYPGMQGNSFSPGGQNGLATGIYTLQYNTASTPNPLLCADHRTITVSVLNPIVPTIAQVGPYCNNVGAVQLAVNAPDLGHWTTAPYLSANGVFTPSLSAIGNNNVQYVVGTSTCNVQQTKIIKIEAFVPATITSTIPDLCNTSPVLNLSPFTLSNLGVWSGAGISGTSFNPVTAGSGEFTLQYNTNSSPTGLCPDVASISVHVFSLAVPAVTQPGPFCNSSLPIQLQVSPVGGLFGGPNVGVVSAAGKFNPASALIGDNIINYSITAGPCVAYAQTIVKVEKFISADFSKIAGPYCKTTDPINMNNFVQNPGGTWETYQSSPGLLGNMFHPANANTGNTNLLIYRTHSMPNAALCPDSSMVRIDVREATDPKVTVSKDVDCVPMEVIFNNPGINSGVGIWSFEDGTEPVEAYSTSHIFTVPGTYQVQYNYTNEIGCKSIPVKARSVTAHEVPKADFSVPDEIYITEPNIQLTNLTTVLGNNTYQWKITGALNPTTEVSPVVTVPKIGKYQITLTATSIYGCKDEITKTIEVKNVFNVFIPNSFTPNFDGLNDYFIPVFSKEGLDLKSFEMEIFDRWGHSLYHTKDASGKGWDGSIQNKGEPLKEEVYVYRIKYKDMDGNAYNKMGHLSLVK